MSDYDKWLDKLFKAGCRGGLSQRDVFEAGKKVGLERGREAANVRACLHNCDIGLEIGEAFDKLSKEADDE